MGELQKGSSSRKKVDQNGERNGTSGKVKKSKFKKIRGFLTGESRRERKAKKAAMKKSKAGSGSEIDEDEETVYGAAVDAQTGAAFSGASQANLVESSTNVHSLQVILLLLDPETRRFELLQLEFDSLKAVVRDVLAQVPHSVTEEALMKQDYSGVCDTSGTELINSTKLANFCRGSEILVAMPKGLPAKQCAKLAKPILSNQSVMQMLQQSGIDITILKASLEEPKSRERNTQATSSASKKPKKKSSVFVQIIFVLLFAVALHFANVFVTSPMEPGSRLFPGMFKSKCGLTSMLPSCQNANMWLSPNGTLLMYGPDNSLQWSMEGGTCGEGDEDCNIGLLVKDDGSVKIGGKTIASVSFYNESSTLSPWPFAKHPIVTPVHD